MKRPTLEQVKEFAAQSPLTDFCINLPNFSSSVTFAAKPGDRGIGGSGIGGSGMGGCGDAGCGDVGDRGSGDQRDQGFRGSEDQGFGLLGPGPAAFGFGFAAKLRWERNSLAGTG